MKKPPLWDRFVVGCCFLLDDLFPTRAPFYTVGRVRMALRRRAMKYMRKWREANRAG